MLSSSDCSAMPCSDSTNAVLTHKVILPGQEPVKTLAEPQSSQSQYYALLIGCLGVEVVDSGEVGHAVAVQNQGWVEIYEMVTGPDPSPEHIFILQTLL